MSAIAESRLLDLTRALVAERSENPPGNEASIAQTLIQWLEDSPVAFDIETQEVEPGRPNVIARAGDPAHGSLLLTGHMDVVPADDEAWSDDPFRLEQTEDRIIGRGVADMKGALAAELIAAETYLTGTTDPGEVILAFTVGEETTGFGSEALVDEGIEVDAAVLGEPTDLNICIAQKGVVRYELTVHGQSAHSARPDKGVSAIEGVRVILNRLHELDRSVRADTHTLLSPGTVSVTEVESGLAPNVIPDTASLTVDWRLIPGSERATPEAFDRAITSVIEAISDDATVTIEFDRWLFARATETPRDEPIVTIMSEATAQAGLDTEITGFDAATDARHFVHQGGIPTVLFGPGTIEEDAHTVDESIAIEDLTAAAETYYRTLDLFLASPTDNGGTDQDART